MLHCVALDAKMVFVQQLGDVALCCDRHYLYAKLALCSPWGSEKGAGYGCKLGSGEGLSPNQVDANFDSSALFLLPSRWWLLFNSVDGMPVMGAGQLCRVHD